VTSIQTAAEVAAADPDEVDELGVPLPTVTPDVPDVPDDAFASGPSSGG
jgi:hypothetical protein